MTPDEKTEREHCERVANKYLYEEADQLWDEKQCESYLADLLMRELKAAFEAGRAEGRRAEEQSSIRAAAQDDEDRAQLREDLAELKQKLRHLTQLHSRLVEQCTRFNEWVGYFDTDTWYNGAGEAWQQVRRSVNDSREAAGFAAAEAFHWPSGTERERIGASSSSPKEKLTELQSKHEALVSAALAYVANHTMTNLDALVTLLVAETQATERDREVDKS